MAIIIDLKNAIRDNIHGIDADINFNFNEIETVDYPFIFFYIPSYRLDKAIDSEYWRRLTLMCVLEYGNSENNNQTALWNYADTLSEMVKTIPFKDTVLSGRNLEIKTVDEVLQLTFDLDFYVKEADVTELMQELEFTIKEN
jgi:hypothetical protein